MKFYIVTLAGTPTSWLSYGETKKGAIDRVLSGPFIGGVAKAVELHLDESQTRMLTHSLELGGQIMLQELWELFREVALAASREKVELSWMGYNGV